VRNALAHEAIEVVYQPVVSPGTGSVCAVEALVRIPDGSGGYLHTGDAIELAERTGAIAELDERVFDIACRRVADWRRSPEHRGLTLNVNRSAKDIGKPGFYDRVMAALARTELPPHALTIEITETALLDADERSVTDLIRLNLHGIGLAIDDFGTGYAPLRYLAELPITCIKIDRSFTIGLPHDAKAMTLVRTTIGLAEQLGTSCVVEGVETAHQLGALPQYSRLLVQGYLYSQPLPASAALPAQIRAAQHSSA
jgi:EAL domain-containing protein (putative c-di-GMP-specific phosphodiesterase class I)